MNNILHKTAYGIESNERFAHTKTKIIVCKPSNLEKDLFDEYLNQ